MRKVAALIILLLFISACRDAIVITEIMYHPKDEIDSDGDMYEFIEIRNIGTSERNVSGYTIEGIDYTFAQGSTIAAGQFFVIARDRDRFFARYGFYPDAVYDKNPSYDPAVDDPSDIYKQLSNGGEKLSIQNSESITIFSVDYNDKGMWQRGPDGFGYSLVLIDADADFDAPSNWRASAHINGSPGEEDPDPAYQPGIVINEIYAHTDGDDLDSIELYNMTGTAIDISGWFLADENGQPDVMEQTGMKMYKIPDHTIVEAYGFWSCNENDFNTNNLIQPFSLSEYGDSVFLYSADGNENFSGYMIGQRFGATDNGRSIGRYQTSTETVFTALETVTIGSDNSQPHVGPVVINEIMYNPSAGNTVEFIELYNLKTWPIDLSGWKLEGINFDFPQGTQIPANGYLLIIDVKNPTSSSQITDEAPQDADYTNEINDFRIQNGIPDSIPILADPMVLENEGETLILKKPNGETLEEFIKYIAVDKVTYDDKTPWPVEADGTGGSLERIDPSSYGNDFLNWQASVENGGSPGR